LKLLDVKDKIDTYFNNIIFEEVVRLFESWGVTLIDDKV